MMSAGCEEHTHNHFSHILVPRMVFSDPDELYRDLSDGARGLAGLWCALNAGTAHVAPVRVTRTADLASHETFLIEMPRLDADCLALAIAVVFEKADPGESCFPRRVRYFSLEQGPSLEQGASPETNSPRHYLCEWEPCRGHANWGMLPGPDSGVFLSRVQSLLLTSSE
jgi:hypothetical protein